MCLVMRSDQDRDAVPSHDQLYGPRRGFTLPELLVVLLIILVVGILTLPAVIGSINHRQTSEAARILQGALAGARDQAIRDNVPAGIRLMPDPTLPGTFSRIVPLSIPPNYAEGMVSIYPHNVYPAVVTSSIPALILEESPGYWIGETFLPNAPVAWAGNIRIGDRVQIVGAGLSYTVIGPTTIASQDLTINSDPLTRTLTSPSGRTSVTVRPEYLVLVNGRDDNGNGWIDEGFDGVDNNGDGQIDEPAEWETETWAPSLANADSVNVSYTIERRPIPARDSREVALPSNVVVEASRSRLPTNRMTGTVDIVLNPNGTVRPTNIYSNPSSVPMDGGFIHFWISERADVGVAPRGEWWITTVFTKTGQVTVIENPSLTDPFSASQQGVR